MLSATRRAADACSGAHPVSHRRLALRGQRPGKECTPQPALEVLTTIGMAIVAAAMLLLIYNRITHRWASYDVDPRPAPHEDDS